MLTMTQKIPDQGSLTMFRFAQNKISMSYSIHGEKFTGTYDVMDITEDKERADAVLYLKKGNKTGRDAINAAQLVTAKQNALLVDHSKDKDFSEFVSEKYAENSATNKAIAFYLKKLAV